MSSDKAEKVNDTLEMEGAAGQAESTLSYPLERTEISRDLRVELHKDSYASHQ